MGLVALIMFAHTLLSAKKTVIFYLKLPTQSMHAASVTERFSWRDAVASCNSDFWSVTDSNSWQR